MRVVSARADCSNSGAAAREMGVGDGSAWHPINANARAEKTAADLTMWKQTRAFIIDSDSRILSPMEFFSLRAVRVGESGGAVFFKQFVELFDGHPEGRVEGLLPSGVGL